jgi:hypothetical protein
MLRDMQKKRENLQKMSTASRELPWEKAKREKQEKEKEKEKEKEVERKKERENEEMEKKNVEQKFGASSDAVLDWIVATEPPKRPFSSFKGKFLFLCSSSYYFILLFLQRVLRNRKQKCRH